MVTPESSTKWASYKNWNDALYARYFATSSGSGRPVYLDTDDDVLTDVGRHAGLGATLDFKAAVRDTLDRSGSGSRLFDEHKGRLRSWTRDGRKATPPFIALLSLFCLTATEMKTDEEYRSNNFYLPLTRQLGMPDTARQDVSRAYAAIDEFWRALTDWQSDAEGQFGFPTAFPLDHRVHVSIPLSQALLREQDRDAFADLFIAHGLRPGQVVSRSDMQRLLQDWVPGSRLSLTAKRLWQNSEVKERVAEIATVELRLWDGGARNEDVDHQSRARISLLGTFRRFPRMSLTLSLVVPASNGLFAGPYGLATDASEPAKMAMEALDGQVHLVPSDIKGWRVVSDYELISLPDVILGTIKLASKDGRHSLERNARGVIVLTYDEELAAFVETGHVELARETMLLVVDRLVEKVESTLTQIARPGYVHHTAATVAGQPEGWTLFTGVQVLGLLSEEATDLEPLMPLSWSSLEVCGGLRVGHNTWLKPYLPELVVSSHDAKSPILSFQQSHSVKEPTISRKVEGTEVIDLAQLELEEADYLATLHDGRKLVASAILRIRTADNPRPNLAHEWIGHDLDEPAIGALSASSGSTPSAGVVGSSAFGEAPASAATKYGAPPVCLEDLLGRWDESSEYDELEPGSSKPMASGAQACITGAHRWVIQPVTNLAGFYRPHSGYCRNCGLADRFPPSPRAKKEKVVRKSLPAPRQLPDLGVTRNTSRDDFDALLGALSYEGEGTWSSFVRLVAQIDDSPVFAFEAMRQLVALGHIDVSFDLDDGRPTHWFISPATFAILPEADLAILVGRRSPQLLSQVEQLALELDMEPLLQRGQNGPSRFAVRARQLDVYDEFAESAREEWNLETVRDPSRAILRLLPALSDVIRRLPMRRPPTTFRVQKFDGLRNRWDVTETLKGPGAYRFPTTPRATAVNDGEVFRFGEPRVVKLWALKLTGQAPFAYEPKEQSLIVRSGSELPGLYGRVAVLCSGIPPIRRSDGTSVYTCVPTDTASALWEKMTS